MITGDAMARARCSRPARPRPPSSTRRRCSRSRRAPCSSPSTARTSSSTSCRTSSSPTRSAPARVVRTASPSCRRRRDEGRPTVSAARDAVVLDDDMNPVVPAAARSTPRPHGQHPDRLPQGPREDGRHVRHGPRRHPLRHPWRLRPGGGRRLDHDARPRFGVDQHGRREGLPEEVENALKSHPEIFDAVVVGVPDDRWGERIVAVIQPRPGALRISRACRPTAASTSPGTRCPAVCAPSTRWCGRRPARATTAGEGPGAGVGGVSGPLAGIRVVELVGQGPGPYCGCCWRTSGRTSSPSTGPRPRRRWTPPSRPRTR